jgi:hypothetical protein
VGIKVEVTEKGAHFTADGKTNEIPFGTELTFDSNEVPAFLVNKCRVIGETKAKELKTAEKQAEKKAE